MSEHSDMVEIAAHALFRKHYQRNPDTRDREGLEMASYRLIADTVLRAVLNPLESLRGTGPLD